MRARCYGPASPAAMGSLRQARPTLWTMSGRLTQVAAVAVAAGGLYLAGTLSAGLTEHQSPEPKASRTVTEKDPGKAIPVVVRAWPGARAHASVAGRAAWRMMSPGQLNELRPGARSRR